MTEREVDALAACVESAVSVDARTLSAPTVLLEVLDGELCLRVEDERRPEVWIHVRLPACAIRAMADLLGDVDHVAPEDVYEADPFVEA